MGEAAECNDLALTHKIRLDWRSGSPAPGESAPAGGVISLGAEPIGAEQAYLVSGRLPGDGLIIHEVAHMIPIALAAQQQGISFVYLSTIEHH